MALDNLISLSFNASELKLLDEALRNIGKVLQGKTVNLSPDERRQYGRIAEQNKLFVNKAQQYMEMYPEYVPRFIDYKEFMQDYQAREQIDERLLRLESLVEQLQDSKTLLDHDNYNNALTFYRNMKFMSRENVPGTTAIYKEMKQFFTASSAPKPKEEGEEKTEA